MAIVDRKVWELNSGPSTPLGHQKVTVSSTAQALPSIPAQARRAVIRPLLDAITYRDDGTDPTATTGFPILKDEVFVYDGDLATFKMIRITIDADVRIVYYG